MKPRAQTPSMSLFSRFFGCFFSRPDPSEYLDEEAFPDEKPNISPPSIEKNIKDRIASIHCMVLVAFEDRFAEGYTAYDEWVKFMNKNYHLISDDKEPLECERLISIPELELKFISLLTSEKTLLERFMNKVKNSADHERWQRIIKEVYRPTKLFIHRLKDIVYNIQQCEKEIELFQKLYAKSQLTHKR